MFRRKTWAGLGALSAALVASVTFGGTAFAASGWTTATIPSTGNNVSLLGASARTNTDAWAVGQQFGAAGQAPTPPVVYHWNGSAWSLTATPSLGEYGALQAVSASSATDAWAVGFTFIRRHDRGVLIEHWNGTAWSTTSVDAIQGSAAGLTGVVDLSPGNAWAVGNGATGELLEHWNGTAWSVVTLPDPDFHAGAGQAISATSASDIWLVGTTFNAATGTVAEALHFDGTFWTVVPMQQPSPGPVTPTIAAVTPVSANSAWAVGEDIGAGTAIGGSTLIEHWNGTRWSIVPSPTPGGDPFLTGVAARSATDVYAVGNEMPSVNGGPQQSLILRWNGSAWSADSVPTAGGFSPLSAAATFPGAASEWAVGTSSSDQGLILGHG
jgi:hypothetical protein